MFLNNLTILYLASLSSIFVGLTSGSRIIEIFEKINLNRHPIRSYGPESHLETKKNTSTMGGLIILVSFLSSVFFFIKTNPVIWVIISTTILYSALGASDDLKKILFKDPEGIRAKKKFLMQFLISLPPAYFFGLKNNYTIHFPFNIELYLGYFYIVFASFVIVSVVNATNITDGLDGLVSVPLIIAISCFVIFSYCAQQIDVAILGICFIGGIMSFLWFNVYPAKIFMGDMGSLGCGGFLSTFALATKKEIMLIPVCFLFIIEILSVIIQVYYYKKTKKRIFLMAPIHHHFEKKGWHETTIVKKFWLISVFSAIFSLLIWSFGY